jgi:sporulation protein YabP
MENNKSSKIQRGHIVHIDDRQRIDITGVEGVVTFNEENVIVNTTMGVLNIKGRNMKVNKLNVDSGDMSVAGEINSVVYESKDRAVKGSILKKLFK